MSTAVFYCLFSSLADIREEDVWFVCFEIGFPSCGVCVSVFVLPSNSDSSTRGIDRGFPLSDKGRVRVL